MNACWLFLLRTLSVASLPRAGLRVVFHGPYAIYYRSTASGVTIIRVLHGARDLSTIIDQEGFDA